MSTPTDGPTTGRDDHATTEHLIDLALGLSSGEAARDHVASCSACAADLESWRLTLDATRADERLVPPPPSVWDAIDAATSSTQDLRPLRAVDTVSDGAASSASRPARPHRVRSWGLAVAAAAAGIVIGSAGTFAAVSRMDDADRVAAPAGQKTTTDVVMATAALRTMDAKKTLGTAVVESQGGSRVLDITTTGLQADGGYLEVWLINKDRTRMVSVGVLPRGTGRYTFSVPAELLANGYTIVDISREAMDDKPAHSGDSLVRGALSI